MSKKPPDHPPPKESTEERAFHDLLKKLVQVPKREVDALETRRAKRKRREQRPKK